MKALPIVSFAAAILIASAWLPAAFAQPAASQHAAGSTAGSMSMQATGTFEVRLNPQPADEYADGSSMGRITIDKKYLGDLDATGRGQMLTGMTDVEGSAGYVAIERVSGTLVGRTGTFLLQHTGIMARGEQHLELRVIPDSGTGELEGLEGSMSVSIEDGVHSYVFEYELPALR